MEINEIVYCKTTGSPFRIKRFCSLNFIKHIELESISNIQNGKKLLSEASVKVSFQNSEVQSPKASFTKFAQFLKG
jgi:hypothetical protein